MSKLSSFKNCSVALNPLPVYQVPPPPSIPTEVSIDPVVPAWNDNEEVIHSVFVVSLSLYFHVTPLDAVGRFEYLPAPSCQDWETANVSILRVFVKFWGSVIINWSATLLSILLLPLLNIEDPIVSDIKDLISSFLNLIRILEG